jgi:hypothetical protein
LALEADSLTIGEAGASWPHEQESHMHMLCGMSIGNPTSTANINRIGMPHLQLPAVKPLEVYALSPIRSIRLKQRGHRTPPTQSS